MLPRQGDMSMYALIAGGEENDPENQREGFFMKRAKRKSQNEKLQPLSEEHAYSLISRGCNLQEVQRILEIAHQYNALWDQSQNIKFIDKIGWVELLQYYPGILAACVLNYQKKYGEDSLPGSFQKAAAVALDWSQDKVLGFQTGVSGLLVYNPVGVTTDEYLNGLALGYLFHESKAYNGK